MLSTGYRTLARFPGVFRPPPLDRRIRFARQAVALDRRPGVSPDRLRRSLTMLARLLNGATQWSEAADTAVEAMRLSTGRHRATAQVERARALAAGDDLELALFAAVAAADGLRAGGRMGAAVWVRLLDARRIQGRVLGRLGRHTEALDVFSELEAEIDRSLLRLVRAQGITLAAYPLWLDICQQRMQQLRLTGQPAESLARRKAVEELIAVYRRVNPTRGRRALAELLGTAALDHLALGDRASAQTEAARAMALVRPFAAAEPALFGWCAEVRYAVRTPGRLAPDEVLTDHVTALTRAADERPQQYPRQLLEVLAAWSNELWEAGRRIEALERGVDRIALLRRLADPDRPDRYDGDIVQSLSVRGFRLVELGRRDEAFVVLNEAVALARQVGGDAVLAGPLSVRCNLLRQWERADDELTDRLELVELRRRIAAADPGTREVFFGTVRLLAARLSDHKRLAEAEPCWREAIEVGRRLAADDPAFRPRLANALNDFAIDLDLLHRADEAIELVTESISLRRELLTADEDVRPLVLALRNRSLYRSKVRGFAGAIADIDEAVELARPAFEREPERRYDLFAQALRDRAVRHATVGQLSEAVAALVERRRMARTDDPKLAEAFAAARRAAPDTLPDAWRDATGEDLPE